MAIPMSFLLLGLGLLALLALALVALLIFGTRK